MFFRLAWSTRCLRLSGPPQMAVVGEHSHPSPVLVGAAFADPRLRPGGSGGSNQDGGSLTPGRVLRIRKSGERGWRTRCHRLGVREELGGAQEAIASKK